MAHKTLSEEEIEALVMDLVSLLEEEHSDGCGQGTCGIDAALNNNYVHNAIECFVDSGAASSRFYKMVKMLPDGYLSRMSQNEAQEMVEKVAHIYCKNCHAVLWEPASYNYLCDSCGEEIEERLGMDESILKLHEFLKIHSEEVLSNSYLLKGAKFKFEIKKSDSILIKLETSVEGPDFEQGDGDEFAKSFIQKKLKLDAEFIEDDAITIKTLDQHGSCLSVFYNWDGDVSVNVFKYSSIDELNPESLIEHEKEMSAVIASLAAAAEEFLKRMAVATGDAVTLTKAKVKTSKESTSFSKGGLRILK